MKATLALTVLAAALIHTVSSTPLNEGAALGPRGAHLEKRSDRAYLADDEGAAFDKRSGIEYPINDEGAFDKRSGIGYPINDEGAAFDKRSGIEYPISDEGAAFDKRSGIEYGVDLTDDESAAFTK
ncbi:hypothetical protein FOMPIDRAFT_1018582 [Fomitopsis schrenkii]|uniref:Uncharacterized protein n=1 Tax=Fomitopsis schrenkii TaxID=2126942 RepID=S8E0H3_FOMSC|nr:hypothetical protein FOMPIDRAFT_1018582 [Fomitopsis schrenkii]